MRDKKIHPWFRNAFHIGSLLSLMAGIQLFVLSERTDVYFAWTIQSALTAATLGGFYFGTMTFGYLSARETKWANVRGPALGLFIFVLGSLAATFLHLDKFHLASENLLTRAAAWIWLAIYIFLPLGLGMTFILQSRLRNEPAEAPLTAPLPVWVRTALAIHGVVGVATAFGLFLLPKAIIPIWPWALTPLTARALSAWFLSFGALELQAVRENEGSRVKVMSVGLIVSGASALVALIRYAGEANLLSAGGLGYLAYIFVLLGIGVVGLKVGKSKS